MVVHLCWGFAFTAAFLRLLIQITCIFRHLKGSKRVETFRRGGGRPGSVEVLRVGEQGLHRLGWTESKQGLIDSGLVGSTDFHSSHQQGHDGGPREQKMLKGHLPRVIYHQVYEHTPKISLITCVEALRLQGYLVIRKCPPSRTIIGPEA